MGLRFAQIQRAALNERKLRRAGWTTEIVFRTKLNRVDFYARKGRRIRRFRRSGRVEAGRLYRGRLENWKLRAAAGTGDGDLGKRTNPATCGDGKDETMTQTKRKQPLGRSLRELFKRRERELAALLTSVEIERLRREREPLPDIVVEITMTKDGVVKSF